MEDGALLLDVRGITERRRDGVSTLPHHWHSFGPDRWGAPTEAERAEFLGAVAAHGDVHRRRLLVLCSVGVRSDAAARVLTEAGYHATNIRDGWLGNRWGAGLREHERMMEE